MWGGATLFAGISWEILLGSQVPTIIGLAALVGSYGIAITKYRLYDIDVIISKTFVYGSLAAFIGGVYVAVVVGIGAALGGGTDPNPVLAVVATALVAVAFQPLRSRLSTVANRIVVRKTCHALRGALRLLAPGCRHRRFAPRARGEISR